MPVKLISAIIILVSFLLSFYSLDWSKVFAGILLATLLVQGSKQEKIFNPYSLLTVTVFSFLVYFPHLGGVYTSELMNRTKLLIILCLLSVILGFKYCENKRITRIDCGQYSENYWLCFLVGALPTILGVYLYGNTLDMTGEEMIEAKEKITLPFLGQFAYWLPASIIVACKKNSSKWILISLFVSIFVAMISVTKTGMLMALIFFLIGITAFKPDLIKNRIFGFLKKSVIIWLPVLILAYFSYNNSIRHEATSNTSMAYVESSGTSSFSHDDISEGFFLNYLYFSSPWSNLDYNIQYQNKKGYGVNTIFPITRLLRFNIPKVRPINPYFLNTHSYITEYYIDFGYVGAIFMSFVLGYFIFYCYRKFGLSNDPLLISFYVIIAYGTVMMFFSNHFNNGYQLNYFISMVGYSFIFRNRGKKTL